MKTLMSLLLMTFLSTAIAGENPLSSISGKGITLSHQGHALSGHIGDNLVFGIATGDHHDKSTLLIHNEGKVIRTEFSNQDGEWSGTISEQKKKSVFKFVSFDKLQSVYTMSFNGREFDVKVGYDKYEDDHFVNPSYTMNYLGKKLKVKMKEGHACKKYSLHLIFMIFAPFLHSL